MGKHRRIFRDPEKEQADKLEKEERKRIDGWWKVVKETGQRFADDYHWQRVRTAQANRLDYIMELSGAHNMNEIDWSRPDVRMIMLLCDPVIIRDLQNPNRRQRVYDMMDEYLWEFYITAHDFDNPDKMLRDTIESKFKSGRAAMKYIVTVRSKK